MGATISALCLGIAGAVLLFAPQEAGSVLVPGSSRPVLVQLLGGALVGYGIANWTARGSALGGIYGRAVVAGNQAHFMIGALLLLTQRDVGAAHPAVLGAHCPLRDRRHVLFVSDVFQLGAQREIAVRC